MMALYALDGHPNGHGRSPLIRSTFAREPQRDLLYKARLMQLGAFDANAEKCLHHGSGGLNVTVPFKEYAIRFATTHTPRALRARAVNTLKKLPDGSILADNTDGVGLVRDLTLNHQVPLAGKRILLLGAGGAVRGVLQPLLEQQPAELVIANRTVSK